MLLIFFKGGLLEKAFLYISAWLFGVLSTSLNEFAVWLLLHRVSLTYGQISVVGVPGLGGRILPVCALLA